MSTRLNAGHLDLKGNEGNLEGTEILFSESCNSWNGIEDRVKLSTRVNMFKNHYDIQ